MSTVCKVRRYKNGAWEDIDDRVSREEAFWVTWRGPEELDGGANRAGDGRMAGRVKLWAWPGNTDSHGPMPQNLNESDLNEQSRSELDLNEQSRSELDLNEQSRSELALGHVLLECVPQEQTHALRGTVTATSEGFCVNLRIAQTPAPMFTPELAPELLLARMDAFMGLQGLWDGTGCFHRAGIWLPDAANAAATLHVAEDIGRHNCLDRLMGYGVMHNVTLRGQVLFVTARITASLYTKAKRMGFGGIVSRSAVSLYAAEAAQRDNVRLVGFCRPREARFTVYS